MCHGDDFDPDGAGGVGALLALAAERERADKAEKERDEALKRAEKSEALAERRKKALEPLIAALGCEYPVVSCHHGEDGCWSTENCERMQREAQAAHDAENGKEEPGEE